jgi:hypothetical protein
VSLVLMTCHSGPMSTVAVVRGGGTASNDLVQDWASDGTNPLNEEAPGSLDGGQ